MFFGTQCRSGDTSVHRSSLVDAIDERYRLNHIIVAQAACQAVVCRTIILASRLLTEHASADAMVLFIALCQIPHLIYWA